jgi:hypothetical protein
MQANLIAVLAFLAASLLLVHFLAGFFFVRLDAKRGECPHQRRVTRQLLGCHYLLSTAASFAAVSLPKPYNASGVVAVLILVPLGLRWLKEARTRALEADTAQHDQGR